MVRGIMAADFCKLDTFARCVASSDVTAAVLLGLCAAVVGAGIAAAVGCVVAPRLACWKRRRERKVGYRVAVPSDTHL